jgi:hypothetical protein
MGGIDGVEMTRDDLAGGIQDPAQDGGNLRRRGETIRSLGLRLISLTLEEKGNRRKKRENGGCLAWSVDQVLTKATAGQAHLSLGSTVIGKHHRE